MNVLGRISGRIGRRYWMRRISAALDGAYRAGLIDTYVLHEIDGAAKYHAVPKVRRKCPACFYGGSIHEGGTESICKSEGCRAT